MGKTVAVTIAVGLATSAIYALYVRDWVETVKNKRQPAGGAVFASAGEYRRLTPTERYDRLAGVLSPLE